MSNDGETGSRGHLSAQVALRFDARDVTLWGLRGGLQGSVPLSTAVGLIVRATSKQWRIRVNYTADNSGEYPETRKQLRANYLQHPSLNHFLLNAAPTAVPIRGFEHMPPELSCGSLHCPSSRCQRNHSIRRRYKPTLQKQANSFTRRFV